MYEEKMHESCPYLLTGKGKGIEFFILQHSACCDYVLLTVYSMPTSVSSAMEAPQQDLKGSILGLPHVRLAF